MVVNHVFLELSSAFFWLYFFSWLVGWFGLVFFLFLFFLFWSLLIYHYYWRLVQLFRLQTSLAFSFSVTNFPYIFPSFCPWKISCTFISLLTHLVLVNDLILKTQDLFAFIENSNPSVPPGAANPLQPCLYIHIEDWIHTSDIRYFLKAFLCVVYLTRICTICWTELSSCRFASDLNHFAAAFYPSPFCFLCIKISFYYHCARCASIPNQKV